MERQRNQELIDERLAAFTHESVIENTLGLIREISDPMDQLKTIEQVVERLEAERYRVISEL